MLGYTLSPSLLQRIGLLNARIYVSAKTCLPLLNMAAWIRSCTPTRTLANYADMAVGIGMGTYPPSAPTPLVCNSVF